jgi:hypothetical protein
MRVLVVLSEPFAVAHVQQRCAGLVNPGVELAVCCVVDERTDLQVSLEHQRRITVALRRAFGALAETIAVFIVTNGEGDRVEDCARAWGATEVRG